MHQEAIVGKCNVVCISKDVGNPQPSGEAKADYVYYRFFDVVQLKVVDQIDVKVAAGTEGIMWSYSFGICKILIVLVVK